MSRDKGNRAAAWVARYLSNWWPHAEKNPNGLPGPDILGTPGVAFEVKTGVQWRTEWMDQAARNGHGELPVLVYLPPGCGEMSVGDSLAVMPLKTAMVLLWHAGYTPRGKEEGI